MWAQFELARDSVSLVDREFRLLSKQPKLPRHRSGSDLTRQERDVRALLENLTAVEPHTRKRWCMFAGSFQFAESTAFRGSQSYSYQTTVPNSTHCTEPPSRAVKSGR